MADKTQYYFEVRVPSAAENKAVETMRHYMDLHIEETGSKMTKILKEFVFAHVEVHNQVGDTQAITLEFNNKRNYNTYLQVSADFRAWVNQNHGVEYVFEKESTYSYDSADIDYYLEGTGKRTYHSRRYDYMNVELPTERGFK